MVLNLKDLMAKFSDEEACKQYLAQMRWPDGKPQCPHCGHDKAYSIDKGKRFKCANSDCYKKFSVTVGTIFHASNVPLTLWFPALYLIASHKKGISSLQLSKDLGVTQKTSWFMLHRIREALREKESPLLSNVVEVDESYIGGKMKNKHKSVRTKAHLEGVSHTSNKTGVMGFLERGTEETPSQVRIEVMDKEKRFKKRVINNVSPNALVITDSHNSYYGLSLSFARHEIVNHDEDEFVRDRTIHTNSIESFFYQLKRMLIGIYHQVSVEHLSRYCDEAAYRHNTRKMKDGDRFSLVLTQTNCKLPYKILVQHGKSSKKESQPET